MCHLSKVIDQHQHSRKERQHMAKKKTKSMTKKEEKAVKKPEPMGFDENERPDYLEEEDVSVPVDSGLAFPVIKLMQALSPELDEDDPKFIEDAETGDILITDGQDHVLVEGSEGIQFIPILVKKTWVEWIPRKQGGGYVDTYNSKAEMEANRNPDNDIAISIDYLVSTWDLDPEADEPSVVLLQFNSPTKMGPARVISKLSAKHQTLSGIQYRLKAKKAKNRANQVYYNFDVEPSSWVQEDMYDAIEGLKKANETLFLPPDTGTTEF